MVSAGHLCTGKCELHQGFGPQKQATVVIMIADSLEAVFVTTPSLGCLLVPSPMEQCRAACLHILPNLLAHAEYIYLFWLALVFT